MFVVGPQQAVVPRQHFHVQGSNRAHIVGPHTRYTKHHRETVAKAIPHTILWNTYVPPNPLATPPEYQGNPIPEENLACIVHILTRFSRASLSLAVITIKSNPITNDHLRQL